MRITTRMGDTDACFSRIKIIMFDSTDGRDEDVVLVCRFKGNFFEDTLGCGWGILK